MNRRNGYAYFDDSSSGQPRLVPTIRPRRERNFSWRHLDDPLVTAFTTSEADADGASLQGFRFMGQAFCSPALGAGRRKLMLRANHVEHWRSKISAAVHGICLALSGLTLPTSSNKVTLTWVAPLVCERCGAAATQLNTDESNAHAANATRCCACHHGKFVALTNPPLVLRRKADRRRDSD